MHYAEYFTDIQNALKQNVLQKKLYYMVCNIK